MRSYGSIYRGSAPNVYQRESDTLYEGQNLIGNIYGGVGASPLRITFNENITLDRLNTVLQNLVYSNESDALVPGSSSVKFELSNPNGITSTQSITLHTFSVNDEPVLSDLQLITYVPDGAPVQVAPLSTVRDADSSDFDGAALSVSVSENAHATDTLRIQPADEFLVVAGEELYHAGSLVGRYEGGAESVPLTITWTSASTPAIVETVLHSITFATSDIAPLPLTRTITFQLDDGDGNESHNSYQAIVAIPTINRPATISGLVPITYSESGDAVRIAPLAEVTDIDNPSLAGGSLTVAVVSGGGPNDQLTLHPGQIGSSGFYYLQGSGAIYGNQRIALSMADMMACRSS